MRISIAVHDSPHVISRSERSLRAAPRWVPNEPFDIIRIVLLIGPIAKPLQIRNDYRREGERRVRAAASGGSGAVRRRHHPRRTRRAATRKSTHAPTIPPTNATVIVVRMWWGR